MQFRYFLSAIAGLLLLSLQVKAQNMPNGQTAVSGPVVVIAVPQEVNTAIDPNYISSYVPVLPITSSGDLYPGMPVSQARQAIVFKDGFNRTFQTVQQQVTTVNGQARHLVQVYDNSPHQEEYSFLPYAATSYGLQTDALHAQRNYYNNKYPDEGYTCYSKMVNTSSPGARAITTYAPGKSQVGQGRGAISQKILNVAEQVRIWTLDGNGKPVSTASYAAGELFGDEALLPSNSTGSNSVSTPRSRVFTDREGRVILKMVADSNYTYTEGGLLKVKIAYQSTYYVYDEFGRPAYILSPRAVELIENNGWVASQDVLDQLCFHYRYDSRDRKTEQRVPGKGPEYYVYDKLGRLAFYQDSSLKVIHKWLFSIYDGQSRPACSGLYQGAETQATLQAYFYDGINYPAPNLLHYQKDYNLRFDYNTAPSGAEILSYTYYDNYINSDPGDALWSSVAVTGLQASELQTTPVAETPARSNRTQGMVTGTRVKILPSPNALPASTGEWTQSAVFYDDKGRVIYTASNDLYQGNVIHYDYSSNQYDFEGRLLINKHRHGNNNALGANTKHTEWTKNTYDAGTMQLTSSRHKVDDGAWNVLNTFTYDDLGMVKRKTLGNGGEVQDFTYNIRGQLNGINGVYAETGSKDGVSRTFGEALKYDYGFNQLRYDGKIAGMIWRGSSSDALSGTSFSRNYAYGYNYDQSGRLKKADFNLQVNSGATITPWSNTTMDYSVSNLFYDKNGNLLSMKQRGVKPGTGPVDMDVLGYRYGNSGKSNQLLAVTDNGVADYGASDFQNMSTATNDDYTYDGNGNLTKDLNKGISNISYTFFNKPLLVQFANGNSIQYSYDAAGSKLQEIVKTAGQPDKRTDYQGNFVYRNDSLDYILTGEGRTLLTDVPTNDSSKEEFFVKDHLGNVRSTIDVVTYLTRKYLATYEIASANLEGLIFDNLNEIRDDKPGSSDPGDLKSGRLNGAEPDRRIGTSLLVKMMAGDKISLNVNNYFDGSYKNADDSPVAPEEMLGTLVSTLSGGGGGFEGSESHDTKAVDRLFTTDNYTAFQTLTDNATDADKPRAYLNYVFFDEDMKLVPELSGTFQANGNGTWGAIGTPTPMAIPINGFMAVYLSNSSNVSCGSCGDVFFDQLWVEVSKGNLLEENHYYPHGLPVYGLSAQTEGFKEQRRRYQGNEYIKDLGLNWMDFQARQYDPQTGRFLGVDPLAASGGQDMFSPYAAMGNMPESMIDPNGEQTRGAQQEQFSPSNNSMGSDFTMASDGLTWLFKGDAEMGGNAIERSGGGPTWCGLSGAALRIHLKNVSAEDRAIILSQIYGTGSFVANIVGTRRGYQTGDTNQDGEIEITWHKNSDSKSDVTIRDADGSVVTRLNKYGGLDAYRAWQDYPGEIPGETWFDRFCRHVASSHREEMLDFGGGGYNMFGGYGKIAQAAKGAEGVFAQTAKDGDLLFYSTKIGDDVIEFGGIFSKSDGTLTIKDFDIDGALTNKLGIRGLKNIVTDFGRQQGVSQVIIQGAKRTTGANPGKIPSLLIFKID